MRYCVFHAYLLFATSNHEHQQQKKRRKKNSTEYSNQQWSRHFIQFLFVSFNKFIRIFMKLSVHFEMRIFFHRNFHFAHFKQFQWGKKLKWVRVFLRTQKCLGHCFSHQRSISERFCRTFQFWPGLLTMVILVETNKYFPKNPWKLINLVSITFFSFPADQS